VRSLFIYDTWRGSRKQRKHRNIVRPFPCLRNTSHKVIFPVWAFRFLLEQPLKLRTNRCRSSVRRGRRLSLAFRESKEVAKVSCFLIEDRVGLWFSARVCIPRIVEDAVQTTAQIRSTSQTRIPPPDPILEEDFPLALITRFHSHTPGSVLIRYLILA
jgi:hypothetical protein